MMWFFEKERDRVKERLVGILDKEIESMRSSIAHTAPRDAEVTLELQKVRVNLRVRKSLAEFEAEEIVKKRIDIRIAVFAFGLSLSSFVVSIYTLFKI